MGSMVRAVGLALGFALLTLPTTSQAADPADRNVVLVIMDDTGTDLFGAYGEVEAGMSPPPEHLVTPNIQELADRGVLFRDAWSGPFCSTTRATIMTGQFAFRNGLGGLGSLPPPEQASPPYVPLAQLLGASPARTLRSMIGKWHVTDFSLACATRLTPLAESYYTPLEAGFTQYQGYPDLGGSQYGWCEVVEGTGPTEPCDGPYEFLWPPVCTYREAYETSAEVDRAVAFLNQAPQQPWFLQLSFHSVHAPREAPPGSLRPQTPDPLPDEKTKLRAMLEAMDTELGRFLDRLELYDCGVDDCHLSRTTVILVGDNGTAKGVTLDTAVNRGSKSTIYEGGINVPLIVTGDAVHASRRGTESAALVHTSDLYPTIAQMTGRPQPTGIAIDGVSFAKHLALADAPPPRSCVYADGRFNQRDAGLHSRPRDQHNTAARNATHKLIRWADETNPEIGYAFYGLGPDGHLDEGSDVVDTKLPIPTHPSDPTFDSYQQLYAQLQLDVASPCKPAEPLCGLGTELVPVLLVLRARLRRKHASSRPQ